jgi:hypothetical protein
MELQSRDTYVSRTMDDEITSSKHHYIPRFYLKGFTDGNDMLYRYDKLTHVIKYVGRKGVFWEENLNTGAITHPETGEMHLWDFPEHLFAGVDSILAKPLEIIRNTDATTNILDNPAMVDIVKQLIHFLFWRVPANIDHLNSIIDGTAFGDLGFGFFDANGKRLKEWEETMKGVDLWRKLYPALIALGRQNSAFKKNNKVDWGVYYMNWNHALTTDNPIILRSFNGPASLEANLLFPLSVNILAVAVEGKKEARLPAVVREQIDVLLFHQAKRYVACPKREYIVHIKDKFENFYSPQVENWSELLKEQIFDTLTERTEQI